MDNVVKSDLYRFKSSEYVRLTLYAYASEGNVSLFQTEKPNTERLEFTFWEMTNAIWEELERYSLEDYSPIPQEKIRIFNHKRMKEFYLRHMLRSWNLDFELSWDEEGKLDDSSWEKVMSLHPAILRKLSEMVFRYTFSDEENATIQKQCHLLFANGSSVNNPHEMISLYCTLADMWKHFGLNYFDLKRLPIKTRNALRMITSIETQVQNAKLKQMENKSNTHVGRRIKR